MATPPYSYTQTPPPGTPDNRTAALNVAPIRPGTFGRTDFNALAQQRRTEIFTHLKPALELLDKFRHESYEIPVLREMYEKITKEIRVPFCSSNGIFNTLGGGSHSQKHHSEGIGPLHHGDLSKRGYSVKKGKTARHRALKKVVRDEGPLSTFRKLNAVATYTKNESPSKSKTFKRDRNWIKKTFMNK
jgi:hypothetical protein